MFRFTIRDVLAATFLIGLGIGLIRILAQYFDSPIWFAIPAAGSVALIGSVAYVRCLRPNKASWGEIAAGVAISLFLLAAVAFYYACVSDVIYVRLP